MYLYIFFASVIRNAVDGRFLFTMRQMQGLYGVIFFFFFKQKTAYEIGVRLVGSEMCIRDRLYTHDS